MKPILDPKRDLVLEMSTLLCKPQGNTVHTIPISDHIPWCCLPRKGLPDLLRDPRRSRVCRGADVNNPPTLVPQHNEHE